MLKSRLVSILWDKCLVTPLILNNSWKQRITSVSLGSHSNYIRLLLHLHFLCCVKELVRYCSSFSWPEEDSLSFVLTFFFREFCLMNAFEVISLIGRASKRSFVCLIHMVYVLGKWKMWVLILVLLNLVSLISFCHNCKYKKELACYMQDANIQFQNTYKLSHRPFQA